MLRESSSVYDVLGLGCTAVDDVLFVPSYPAMDAKTRVVSRKRQFGGLTGTALVTASRLGARCAYAGCLGTDEASTWIADRFRDEGIEISAAPRLKEAAVVQSTIIVAEDTGLRSVFYSCEGMIGAHPAEPPEDILRATKVLFLDHYGMRGNLRAARIARASGIGVVADFEDATDPLFPELLALVDHLILSAEMAGRITGCTEPAAAARLLWREDRAAVVITCGADGCWSLSAAHPAEPCHHLAFTVKAVDTNGCGDVFHGAYAAGLARGLDLPRRLRLAAAAAALKAAQALIPSMAAIKDFLLGQPESAGTSPL
ncbi:MAG: PfkB family carbohydrate kinase [Chthoniobacter sp.]|nr:PfkB family carbohydrate kinase [Chthoniobacter sp.]